VGGRKPRNYGVFERSGRFKQYQTIGSGREQNRNKDKPRCRWKVMRSGCDYEKVSWRVSYVLRRGTKLRLRCGGRRHQIMSLTAFQVEPQPCVCPTLTASGMAAVAPLQRLPPNPFCPSRPPFIPSHLTRSLSRTCARQSSVPSNLSNLRCSQTPPPQITTSLVCRSLKSRPIPHPWGLILLPLSLFRYLVTARQHGASRGHGRHGE
jgi:hypothetical protein